MFTTPDQVKNIFKQEQQYYGTGGFEQGVVTAVDPLMVQLNDRLPLPPSCLYVTENCIGLTLKIQHKHDILTMETEMESTKTHSHSVPKHETVDALQEKIILREPLKVGDAVLLLCRPQTDERQESRYIVLDRLQPYQAVKEVTGQ